jgi:hypothetical protein
MPWWFLIPGDKTVEFAGFMDGEGRWIDEEEGNRE